MPIGDSLRRSANLGGKPDARGKVIRAAAGNIAKRFFCAVQVAGNHLVEGSVTAAGGHKVKIRTVFFCPLGCIAALCCKHSKNVPISLRKDGADFLNIKRRKPHSRNGIDYK